MSDRKQALQDLLAKVEAGDIPDTGVDRFRAIPTSGNGVYADRNHYNARDAYWSGSLDAVKALHEAVLPEWRVSHAWGGPDGWGWNIVRTTEDGNSYANAINDCPARAWLCAIIKALIAEADT